MQFLYAVHAQVFAAFCAFAHGFAAGDGGVLRYALGEGGAADAVAVGNRLYCAADGVDHQCDFAVFNCVHDVWAAFLHFVDRLHDDAVFFQVFSGTASGADTVAECLEVCAVLTMSGLSSSRTARNTLPVVLKRSPAPSWALK